MAISQNVLENLRIFCILLVYETHPRAEDATHTHIVKYYCFWSPFFVHHKRNKSYDQPKVQKVVLKDQKW